MVVRPLPLFVKAIDPDGHHFCALPKLEVWLVRMKQDTGSTALS